MEEKDRTPENDIFGPETPAFTPEQVKLRERRTRTMFKWLFIVVGCMILLLVLSGLLFGNR